MAKKRGHKGKHSKAAAAAATSAAAQKASHNVDEEYNLDEASNVAMASVAKVGAPVMVKMCRLCESKDGPFLNIFDGEKVLAKKINRLLPLVIDEKDTLPHKICFRCSAKVEELHEFAQRCIKAQENLKKSMGNQSKAAILRKNWEEELKVNKISNDDYCQSLIKKAMEKIIGPGGVEDEPVLAPSPTPPPQPGFQKKSTRPQQQIVEPELIDSIDDEPLVLRKQAKPTLDRGKKTKEEKITHSRPTRSKATSADETVPEEPAKLQKKDAPEANISNATSENEMSSDNFLIGMVIKEKSHNKKIKPAPLVEKKIVEEVKLAEKKAPIVVKEVAKEKVNGVPEKAPERAPVRITERAPEKVPEKAPEVAERPKETEEPEFDIMQHVCTIKVGGAGYLFQCKLCKRNFLKKEVVLGHACAKTAAAKASSTKFEVPKPQVAKPAIPRPPPPPLPTVPNTVPKPTRTDKEIIEAFKSRTAGNLSINNFSAESTPAKPKPGPASRKKHSEDFSALPASISIHQLQKTPPPPPPQPVQQSAPSVELPSSFPSSTNRYKLVPGPNNTFTLVEEGASCPGGAVVSLGVKRKIPDDLPKMTEPKKPEPTFPARPGGKRNFKQSEGINNEDNVKATYNQARRTETVVSRTLQTAPPINHNYTSITPDTPRYNQNYSVPQPEHSIPPMMNRMENQPYPVGLFQTIPRSTPPPPQVANFQTQKKPSDNYSYTVVPTGNPSKLVISSKQVPPPIAPAPPTPAPKAKRGKKGQTTPEPIPVPKQPFSVTLEEREQPPKNSTDGFFTFINVDPLLQPSYVLPTTSIIQESQITTSTPAGEKAPVTASQRGDSELYNCQLCSMEFTREKKLLTHIQTHYAKQEEEEDDRLPRSARKRSRKS